MYEKPFALEIVAPDRVVFAGEATSVSAPGVSGGFQVLRDHAALLSALEVGPLKIKDTSGVDTIYSSGGGFLEVHDNKIVLLIESAEKANEIDVNRAAASRDRAMQRLKGSQEGIDIARARASLARALNRLRVAKQPS